jgi:hypothetical protein
MYFCRSNLYGCNQEAIMLKGLEPDVQQQYLAIYREVEQSLREQAWFSDDWQVNINGLDGFATIQLIQGTWIVQPNRPIHLEFYVGETQHTKQVAPIVLHAHAPFPGSETFATRFASETVGLFPEYTVTGKPPFLLLSKELPYTEGTLADLLVTEFSRLRNVDEVVNKIIRETS